MAQVINNMFAKNMHKNKEFTVNFWNGGFLFLSPLIDKFNCQILKLTYLNDKFGQLKIPHNPNPKALL